MFDRIFKCFTTIVRWCLKSKTNLLSTRLPYGRATLKMHPSEGAT